MSSESVSTKRSWGRRILEASFHVSVFVFAAIGVSVFLLELHSWQNGTRWRPEDINSIVAYDSPARALATRAWEDFKFLLQYGALFIGAVAFAAALTKVRVISKIIGDFIVARGPIYSLSTTITEVDTTVGQLSREVARLSHLESTIREISEKLEETFAQISNLQRLAISERTGTADQADMALPPINQAAAPPSEEDKNWDRLRELWNNNGARLDTVIEAIPDKRRRGRFQRMPKTNYPAIINALADDAWISDAARNASLRLHSTFMSYKPRNRKIPDEAVAALVVLDAMLAQQLNAPVSGHPETVD